MRKALRHVTRGQGGAAPRRLRRLPPGYLGTKNEAGGAGARGAQAAACRRGAGA
jgi:hypothetical protein